ncbi:MAG: type 1 periplasmic binding fold superfamily protein [Saprospiraceae bacterium]|nr:type 1 periplasmic binding fold superfamily protein [Saprospiraceae bacterium]
MTNFKFFCSILCIVLWSSSCKKDPMVPNEEELITTMEYNLISKSDASKVVIFTFEDVDGDGGVAPVVTSGLLESNTAYTGTLKLKNTVVNPAIDISEEIKTEANDHQFFFDISEGLKSNILINYDDQDADNKPIGLKTIVQTNNAGREN